MRIIVGIDFDALSREAADLAASLFGDGAAYELVHVVERIQEIGYGAEIPPDPGLVDRFLRQQGEEAHRRLDEASTALRAHGVREVATEIRSGYVANELIAAVAEDDASLIAVGGKSANVLESVFFGSVTRKLVAAAPCSLLVAKPRATPRRPLRALFATDHSAYCYRCAQMLARMAPRGIGHLTVLTAYPKALAGAISAVMPHFKAPVEAWIVRNLEQENQRVVEIFKETGWTFDSRVVERPPEQAIAGAMIEADADLLILGAQGHGFIARAAAGSVSFQLAVKGPHPTLILRLPAQS